MRRVRADQGAKVNAQGHTQAWRWRRGGDAVQSQEDRASSQRTHLYMVSVSTFPNQTFR